MVVDESASEPKPTQITLSSESIAQTWLSGFLAKDHTVHFHYAASPPGTPTYQSYVRFNNYLPKIDIRHQPNWRGENMSLQGFDGFCSFDPDVPNSTIYCVRYEENKGRISVMYSHDNGVSWKDGPVLAESIVPYSLGGYRHLSKDKLIIGTFTHSRSQAPHPVYFIRARTDCMQE